MTRSKKNQSTQPFRAKISELVGVLNGRAAQINKKSVKPTGYDSLILGDGPLGTYSMDPKKASVNNNVLVIAGTGGGKTKSVVEANLLHAQHQSMAVLLTKRRLIDQYTPLLKKRGYDVKVLDLVHPEKSDVGYDPMLHFKDDADIIELGKALVTSSGCTSVKEPYWENAAADLFVAVVKLARHLYGKQARMKGVLDRIHKLNYDLVLDVDEEDTEEPDFSGIPLTELPPCRQFEALREKDNDMFMSFYQYEHNANTTKACIRSMLISAVDAVMTKQIQRIMAKPEQLKFSDLVDRKTVLFILTSPVNSALHPFANLMLGSMFKELFEYAEELPGGRVPIPLMTICDDFATGGQIPNFQQHISIFREKGISVMMLVQSLAQLAGMYGANASATIQDNTDNILYMGGNNLDTAFQIASRINKPIDEVLALPRGQTYLFRSGQKALQLQRYQIYDDTLYQLEIAPQETGYLR